MGTNKNLGLIPIRNFAALNDNVFRSAQPEYKYEYQWLKNMLGLDTIVNLRSESKHDDLFSKDVGIKVVNLDVPDHHEPTLKQSNHFMDLVKSHINDDKKILFHCEHGRGRTSTFSVLARLAMGWSLERALKEEEKIFHYQFQHHAQLDFLKNNFSKKPETHEWLSY